MKTKNLIISIAMALTMMLFLTLQSCHGRYDEGSEEGHYDTVQPRSNDHTMSSQQHDGLDQASADTLSTADSTQSQQ